MANRNNYMQPGTTRGLLMHFQSFWDKYVQTVAYKSNQVKKGATNKTFIHLYAFSMCGKAPSLVTEDSNTLGVTRLYVGGYNLSN